LLALILGAGLAPAHDLKWVTIDGGGGSCATGATPSVALSASPTRAYWPRPITRSLAASGPQRRGFTAGVAHPAQRHLGHSSPGRRRHRLPRAGNGSLSAPNWRDVNQTPLVVGQENWVVMSATANAEFFRLRKP